jgi:prevent-host-death family protein
MFQAGCQEFTANGVQQRSLTLEIKCVFFTQMKATLTELRRETSRILGPVIHASKKVVITEHGRKIAAIVPIAEPDRKLALKMLAAIGPVEMPNRR